MGYHSNLQINQSIAEAAHSAILDKLKGWEMEEDGLVADWDKLSFATTLTHEDFDGVLELTYDMDETALVGIYSSFDIREIL
ncbi:MAG: hypothetical protein KAF91_00335 [Nostoc sp. TH1S01]|nr:hypothetical protein [Nostoc sp. TH1S01]